MIKNLPITESGPDIRPIADLGRSDIAFAGGKGANLDELTQADLPVPPGFVVGAPTYAAPGELVPPVRMLGRRRRMGEPNSGPHGRG